jgi:hypothetical protein
MNTKFNGVGPTCSLSRFIFTATRMKEKMQGKRNESQNELTNEGRKKSTNWPIYYESDFSIQTFSISSRGPRVPQFS